MPKCGRRCLNLAERHQFLAMFSEVARCCHRVWPHSPKFGRHRSNVNRIRQKPTKRGPCFATCGPCSATFGRCPPSSPMGWRNRGPSEKATWWCCARLVTDARLNKHTEAHQRPRLARRAPSPSGTKVGQASTKCAPGFGKKMAEFGQRWAELDHDVSVSTKIQPTSTKLALVRRLRRALHARSCAL